jgi:hypothetical protein
MEIRMQVFTRCVVRLENRDLLVDPSGVVKPTTWWCTRPEAVRDPARRRTRLPVK